MKAKILSIVSLLVVFTLLVSSISLLNRFSSVQKQNEPPKGSKFIDLDFSEDSALDIGSELLQAKSVNGFLWISEKDGGYNWADYYIPISILNDGSACDLKDYKYITFEFDYLIGGTEINPWYTSNILDVELNTQNDITKCVGNLTFFSFVDEMDTSTGVRVLDGTGVQTGVDLYIDDYLEYTFVHTQLIIDVLNGSIYWYVNDEFIRKYDDIISSSTSIYNILFHLDKGFLETGIGLDNIKAQGFDLNYKGSFEDLLTN